MALFRMLCVRFRLSISLKNMMVALMLVNYSLCFTIWQSMRRSVTTYGSSNTDEFCRGYTTKMAHVLMNQSQEEKDRGKSLLHASILFGQSFIILEFICYLVLFFSLREQNKSFFKILQSDVLEKRAKKNAITFTGQALTFVIEVAFSVLMQVLIHFGKVGGFFEPAALPCANIGLMAAITSFQVLSSPELRRFFQGQD